MPVVARASSVVPTFAPFAVFVGLLACASPIGAQAPEIDRAEPDPSVAPAESPETLDVERADESLVRSVETPSSTGPTFETEMESDAPVSETPVVPATPVAPRRVRFIGFPFAFYLPETSVGFGFGVGISIVTERPREGSPMRWFPSNMTIGGAYTIRNQLRILFTPELYLRRGRVVIDGLTETRLYPDRFYGLGRDTDVAYQRYTDVSFKTSTTIRYQVRRGVYVGAVVDAAVTDIEHVADVDSQGIERPSTPSTNWLGTGAVPGERGSRVFGVGPAFVLDRRDFPLLTTRGFYVRALAVPYPGGGSFSRFARAMVDVRGFTRLGENEVVLGGQWLLTLVGEGAPFNHLASVGGPIGLRSYPDGRFRDTMQTFGQIELRFPIVWRLRGAVHTGIGAVGGKQSLDRQFELLWAAGIGLRAVLLPDRRIAVRGDLVYGPEGLRVLAYVHEAF